MKTNRLKLVISLFLIAVMLTGCFSVNTNFKRIRNHLFENMDLQYDRDIEFAVGPAGLLLAGMVIRFSDADEMADDIVRQISRVQVGIYNNKPGNEFDGTFSSLSDLVDIMSDDDWECIVRSKNSHELTSVFIKYEDDFLNQIFVVTLNEKELVLAEVNGDLAEMVQIAIREKGFNIERIDS